MGNVVDTYICHGVPFFIIGYSLCLSLCEIYLNIYVFEEKNLEWRKKSQLRYFQELQCTDKSDREMARSYLYLVFHNILGFQNRSLTQNQIESRSLYLLFAHEYKQK